MVNYNNSSQSPGNHGGIATPYGWKAEWSAQYATYFYINLSTNESTWTLPSPQPPQQMPQRKPIASSPSQPQTQISAPVAQRPYVESYPTPPPHISAGYFSTVSNPRGPQQQQAQFAHFTSPAQQQKPEAAFQSQTQCAELPAPVQQQPSVQYQQQQFIQHRQQDPQATHTPLPSTGSQHPPVIVTTEYTQPQQVLSPPQTPGSFNPQQQSPYYAPPPQVQQGNYVPSNLTDNALSVTQNPQVSGQYSSSQASQYPQPAQQVAHVPNGHPHQVQPPAQYQPRQPPYQAQPQPQIAVQPQQRTSMMGSSFKNSGGVMGKISSKFTQLQKGAGGAPSAAQAHEKAPADWKKWAKRGAIGVAGVGALALGVDAAGDMFSGAEAFAGGGDFSSGGLEGGMDAQTAIDANAAQLNMEAVGQENAMLLLDPPGTEYVMTNAQDTQGAMGLI